MAKKYIDADRLKQTIADNVYPVQDAFNSRDYGMFWTGGIEKAIDEQPAADVAPRWIPVTERLPEKYGQYLVTFIPSGGTLWTKVLIAFYSDLMGIAKPSFHIGEVGKDSFVNINEQVIAWMPLPTPYKGGEEE